MSNSRSRTPDVPNTPTQSSVSSDDITISITANTVVTSTFGIRVSPAINSATTANISVSGNSTSHTQTQSLKAAFGNTSLSSGQTYSIEVRGQNSHANSDYSSAASISTTAAASISVSATSFSETTSFDSVIYETSEMTITSSNRGGNAVRLRVLSSPAPSGFQVAHTTDNTHPGTGATYTNIPTTQNSTVTLSDADTIKVRLRRNMSSVGTFSIVFDFIIGSSVSPNTANVTQTFIRSSGGPGGGGP